MSKHTAAHGTFALERTFPSAPERVFQAFADPKAKARWFAAPADWEQSRGKMEFKVGGKEHMSGSPPGHQAHVFDAAIVTKIEPGKEFYPAEDYHQDFLTLNPRHPYIVINDLPKVAALKRLFAQSYRAEPVLVAKSGLSN